MGYLLTSYYHYAYLFIFLCYHTCIVPRSFLDIFVILSQFSFASLFTNLTIRSVSTFSLLTHVSEKMYWLYSLLLVEL